MLITGTDMVREEKRKRKENIKKDLLHMRNVDVARKYNVSYSLITYYKSQMKKESE